LGHLEPLFCEFEEEGVEDEADWAVGTNWEHLDEDEDSANTEVVEEMLLHVWSMFQRNWITAL
jgi:hypothetical protein